MATPLLCQLNRVIEAETITSEAINLYEDECLTMLVTETTMDEIEALETKSDDLNGKWLVAGTQEILEDSGTLINDAKQMCLARDQVANLFDENGVVTADANIKNAQTLVSEIAKIKPVYAQMLQVQVDGAIR